MSSLRNIVHRRTHKERSQPSERSKWGLLEKHKDYTLRAKDYNEKRAKLKILRQKATERNADEFHFAMMSHRTVEGGKRAKTSNFAGMSHATSQLLKTQDAGYVRTMIQSTRRARERLAEEVAVQRAQLVEGEEGKSKSRPKSKAKPMRTKNVDEAVGPRTHLVFVDDRAEQKAYRRPVRGEVLPVHRRRDEEAREDGEDDDSDEEVMEDVPPSPVIAKKGRATVAPRTEAEAAEREKAIQAQERTLDALREREKALTEAADALDLQRAKMSNSVGGVNKAGLPFKIKARKR